MLLVGIPLEFITGLLSYAAYNPRLAGNDVNPQHGILGVFVFNWLTSPSWFYHVTEGVHVMLGYALVPVLIAKLWSVIPRLFASPFAPAMRSLAKLAERASLILLVGGVVFQFLTGLLYVDYYEVYSFSFLTGHFFGAWLFMTGFVIHVALKFPLMVDALRSRRLRTELRTPLGQTRPEDGPSNLIAQRPGAPTISRRGALAVVGGSSLLIFVLTAGETIGGWTRRFALFGTHNQSSGSGPNDFPVNHTAASVGITAADTGSSWTLELIGRQHVTLRRDQLLAMKLTTSVLPIACTEGWATTQRWTGIRLSELAALAGVSNVGSATLETMPGDGITTLSGAQVHSSKSLLALAVNGADLSLDHGYPARIIVPTAPGTYNRKWMRRITFIEAG